MIYKVTLKGTTYEVSVENGQAEVVKEYEAVAAAPVAAPAAAPAAAPSATPAAATVTGAGNPINAPMPGTILRVNVEKGAAVKKDQVLLVLEAMKMENEILAPQDGTVTQVVVSKGASVNTGDALIVIA